MPPVDHTDDARMGFWGAISDCIGRRWSMIIPATIGGLLAPAYLLEQEIQTCASWSSSYVSGSAARQRKYRRSRQVFVHGDLGHEFCQ